MKTRELIRLLQESDPSGELEACVGNVDICYVCREPAYYDGKLQVLEYDGEGRVVGGKYVREGSKVTLHVMSINDAISNAGADGKFEVDYSQLSEEDAVATRKAHDALREWHRKLDWELEFGYFREWVKREAEKVTADSEDIWNIAKRFFDKYVSPNDAYPEGGIPLGKSYIEMRKDQWASKFEVMIDDGFLAIKLKEEHV